MSSLTRERFSSFICPGPEHEMRTAFLAIIHVGLLGGDPASWPPSTGSPWRATSLHSFWGKEWHQNARRAFISFGGLPFKYIFKGTAIEGVAFVFGVFLTSGIYHALPFHMYYGTTRIIPTSVNIGFYVAQSFGLYTERIWKWRTGKPVGGIAGWLWMAFWILCVGQIYSESKVSMISGRS